MEKGYLIISLDFELMWGNIETWTAEGYGASHVENVREVINRLLALFEHYQVKASFATVGFIMQKKEEVKIPFKTPSYQNKVLSPYGDFISNIAPQNEHLYFAPDIIEKLKNSSCVEIGTHTYCHFYCWEKGQTVEQFEEDLKMACDVAEENGITLRSIVFPRNQVPQNYLDICAKYGILTYRGNPKKFIRHISNKWVNLFYRAARLIDSYVNLGGNTSYSFSELRSHDNPINIPSSRMLRPYNHKLRFLEGLRLKRIKKEMLYAAKHHEVYHLWWHPHNFGADMNENFFFLEQILSYYQDCRQKYGMESTTMEGLYHSLNLN